jgi:Zn-dependent protease with chaperone function
MPLSTRFRLSVRSRLNVSSRLTVSSRLRVHLCAALLASACTLTQHAAFGKDAIEENSETAYLAHDFIFVDSPELEGYVRSVAQRLLDTQVARDKGGKVEMPNLLLQSSESFTVFTDSNRNLIVSTGALRAIESEDELAAVLGHELAHVILRHPQSKSALGSVPQSVDAISSVQDAAAQLSGKGAGVAASSDIGTFGKTGLANAQTANLLWSDFLSPSWNRKQERAADELGFELMRAAGYDPGAFGVLFQKLHAAETKRTERMQVLKKSLATSARTSSAKLASTGVATAQATSLAGGVPNNLADEASDKLIDGLSTFNREYDSPDERQAALAAYAREHREKKRSPAPEMHWADAVQGGAGAKLLALDANAIATLDALAAKNSAAATKSVASLGKGDVTQPSPHLNLAVGTYYETNGKREIGERAAQAWLEAKHPSAQVYTWSAWYQSTHQNYAGAIETLETGRKRVGSSAPFLPNLVSMAHVAGDNALAERYVQECAAEDRKSAGALKTMLGATSSAPSGLHAECLRRLGYAPAVAPASGVTQALQSAPSAVGSKLKGLFGK